MTNWLVDPNDSLTRQNEKLHEITEVLMRRVEQDTDRAGAAYAQFERAALLEDEVRQRTRDLEHALDLLNESNARLSTATREAEAARSDLANALETVQEGFALFNSDEVLVMCNSRFGAHMPDIQPSLQPGLAFSEYVRLASRSPQLSLPEGVRSEDWARKRMRRHADNHVIFNVRMANDRWVQVSEHRTKDGGTVVLQTDVTDMIRLEREERERLLDVQARMVRATLDHINQGVCIFDSEARLIGWNRKIGALLATPMTQFRLGSQFERLLELLEPEITFNGGLTSTQLLDWVGQKSKRKALSFEIRRGDDMTLDAFAEEMPDKGFVISFTDVTAERETSRALYDVNESLEHRVMERTLELEDALTAAERANASKSRFVAAASHDLLQPLSAAKLYVSALNGKDVGVATREIAIKAESALRSVEGIIDALLDISKLEAGMGALEVTSIPVSRLLEGLRTEYAPLAAEKGLEFRVVTSHATVESDPAYLRRILGNLVSNAIRYTARGKVLLGVRRNGRSLRFEVWDTGPGIPEEDQDTIFLEFQRLNAQASASEGLGLGLAIVERACARLGHPLGLWSEVGRGSSFLVTVALSQQGPQGHKRAAHATSVSEPLKLAGLVVLLVENDLELRRAMCLLLEKWDVSVLDVGSGKEALELLSEIEMAPDAMLVDYQLEADANGLEFIDSVKSTYGEIPTRLISADRSTNLRKECSVRDVVLLNKPIDARSLQRFLSDAAER